MRRYTILSRDMPRLKHIAPTLGLLALVFGTSSAGYCQSSEKVPITPCQLKSGPASYNHKVIEVTGFVSHGFEDFTLFDPACPDWPDVWLEYGGIIKSGTMYCCGVSDSRTRPQALEVEEVRIPLVVDAQFREFDKQVQRLPDSIVHATIVGRFFSGQPKSDAPGASWGGYGHLGCCSLLALQQVLFVDSQEREDLDYRAYPDQPAGCGYRDLLPRSPYPNSIDAQKLADGGQRGWAFDEPETVARDSLAHLLNTDEKSIRRMKQTRKSRGRLAYRWKPQGRHESYMVVVSRPYWLSFYSRDPKRVAWVVISATELSCG